MPPSRSRRRPSAPRRSRLCRTSRSRAIRRMATRTAPAKPSASCRPTSRLSLTTKTASRSILTPADVNPRPTASPGTPTSGSWSALILFPACSSGCGPREQSPWTAAAASVPLFVGNRAEGSQDVSLAYPTSRSWPPTAGLRCGRRKRSLRSKLRATLSAALCKASTIGTETTSMAISPRSEVKSAALSPSPFWAVRMGFPFTPTLPSRRR